MRTNCIDELKKIELNIFDNSYKSEVNRFLSVRVDLKDFMVYSNLSHDDKMKALIQIYFNLFNDKDLDDTETLEKLKNKHDKNYKINELDELFLKSIFKDLPDNLLFIKDIFKSLENNLISSCTFRSDAIANNLIGFINLNLNDFNDFFKFFLTFLCEFIDKIPKEYQNYITHNQVLNCENNVMIIDSLDDKELEKIDIHKMRDCAKLIYKKEIAHITKMQSLFKEFISYIYNLDNENKLKPFSIQQRFYVFTTIHAEIHPIIKNYTCEYDMKYIFSSKEFSNNLINSIIEKPDLKPLSSEQYLLDCIKKYDTDNTSIHGVNFTFVTESIYTYFYLTLYYLTLSSSGYIQKCNYCGTYFFTEKSNILYCNRIYHDGKTCKELGSKFSQKRKEQNEPVYGKYRKIYAKKAMMVKRNPDIEYYTTNYEKWKKEAKQFLDDIKAGKKNYDEFDEWLDENK